MLSQRGNQQRIQVATSEDEARKLLEQEKDYLLVKDGAKRTAIGIATSKEKGGIEEAKRFLGNTLVEDRAAQNTTARNAQATPIVNAGVHHFQEPLAEQIFRVASQGYVSLNPNVQVNGEYPRNAIQRAWDDWQRVQNDEDLDANITNVHFFPPSNKEEQGKGNVGNTLATRKWQANLISTWFGRVINVHIDCSDCS